MLYHCPGFSAQRFLFCFFSWFHLRCSCFVSFYFYFSPVCFFLFLVCFPPFTFSHFCSFPFPFLFSVRFMFPSFVLRCFLSFFSPYSIFPFPFLLYLLFFSFPPSFFWFCVVSLFNTTLGNLLHHFVHVLAPCPLMLFSLHELRRG